MPKVGEVSRGVSGQPVQPYWQTTDDGETVRLYHGDCLNVLAHLKEPVDAVVTDPPYGLEFMGKEWDSFRDSGSAWAHKQTDKPDWKGNRRQRPGRLYMRSKHWTCRLCGKQKHQHDDAACEADYELVIHAPRQMQAYQEWCAEWAAALLRVVKPGGYLLAFGGTRTYHRLTCAIEDAGWEVRDCLMWLYGTGFPKGRGCLKPAYEPIVLARRPGPRVLPLGIDACRVPTEDNTARHTNHTMRGGNYENHRPSERIACGGDPGGRWPANVLHDGSEEVLGAFEAFGESRSPEKGRGRGIKGANWRGMEDRTDVSDSLVEFPCYGDTGTAARFFYCAKAVGESAGHPTVKPVELMRWLVKLVCPKGGVVLDPFLGTGSTIVAALEEGVCGVGVEQSEDYLKNNAIPRISGALLSRPITERLVPRKRIERIDAPKRV